MPLKYRSAYAKFRCEVASLRVETGRYERKTVHERTCLYCTNCVEDEFHVLMQCPLYADLRQTMSNDVLHFNVNFSFLSDADKFVFLFSNENVFNIVTKTCYNILIRRNSFYTISYCVNIILYSFKMLYFIECKSLIKLLRLVHTI
jgi:hypothetical protein